MGQVLVLNNDATVLCFVDWQRAVQLMLSTDPKGTPQATIFKAVPGKMVHSPTVTVPWPEIIQLTRYYYVKHRRSTDRSFATKKDILDRDRRSCAYCGKRGETIDHVYPRSRGGADSWENQVASCHRCNNKKADRTPEEAGMKLHRPPRRPEPYEDVQRAVWAMLSEELQEPA